MTEDKMDSNQLWMDGPHTTLERALAAEYLIINGYLMSDLEALPTEVARELMTEACQAAAYRLAEINSMHGFQWKFRLPICLN